MATASGHTSAILASKVNGTPVYDLNGDKIGHVEDVVLDKLSNNIIFAVLGFGGVLGMGEKFHPIPWSLLDFDPEKGGYVVNVDKNQLEEAKTYDIDALTAGDGASLIRNETYKYYQAEQYW